MPHFNSPVVHIIIDLCTVQICQCMLKKQRYLFASDINPSCASSSGLQQLLVPAAVFLTLAPNIQSLSLDACDFLISEPILFAIFCRIKQNGYSFQQFQCCTSFVCSCKIAPWFGHIGGERGGHRIMTSTVGIKLHAAKPTRKGAWSQSQFIQLELFPRPCDTWQSWQSVSHLPERRPDILLELQQVLHAQAKF